MSRRAGVAPDDVMAPYTYDLPAERIAQEPAPRREDARLLVVRRDEGPAREARVADLPSFLASGDLVVVNASAVAPCRLDARGPGGGRVGLLLLPGPGPVRALARPARRLRPGAILGLPGGAQARVLEREGARVTLDIDPGVAARVQAAHGRAPLPPYIRRAPGSDPRDGMDRERYQTVYAREPGSIAAPTAGMHLTAGILADLAAREIATAHIDLSIGPATFQEIGPTEWASGTLGEETFSVDDAAARAVSSCLARGGRIVAVGTSACRTLESLPAGWESDPRPFRGATRLFVRPGHRFRFVGALLTNFHLPQSPPLVLTSAFAGSPDRLLSWYRDALSRAFRFASYGDAMLIQ